MCSMKAGGVASRAASSLAWRICLGSAIRVQSQGWKARARDGRREPGMEGVVVKRRRMLAGVAPTGDAMSQQFRPVEMLTGLWLRR